MLVTWLGHAQLFVNAAGRTVLIDPWFSEPAFGGAWFRYPPAPYPDASTLPAPDVLVLSHTHADHSGPRTLAQLGKKTRTLAVPFTSGAMKRRLDAAGFLRVEWVEPWKSVEPFPGLKITFVPHDRGWEVASVVLEAEGVRLYHGNDNALSLAAYQEVVQRLGPIDLAFLPYAGASAYPTGFEGDRATLEQRCAQKKKEGLERFFDGLRGLLPKEAAPFASSWALLEDGERWKNWVDRPTHDEALAAAMPLAAELGTHLVRLAPGDEWSPDTGAINKGLTDEWPSTPEAVERYATQESARVRAAIAEARAGLQAPPAATLDQAMHGYFAELLKSAPEQLTMRAGFEAKGVGAWRVQFVPGQPAKLETGLAGDEDEVLTLEPNELWALLTGPTTWEDVWYGYRLRVRKKQGAGYFRAFWELLLNHDDQALSARLARELA